MGVSLAFVFIHYGMEKGENLVTILVEIGIIDELSSFLVVWDCYFSCGCAHLLVDTLTATCHLNRAP